MTDCKFEAGKTYNLRGGQTAEILKVGIKTDTGETIAGLFNKIDGSQDVGMWYPDGNYYRNEISDVDLIPPEPERVSVWMNVYQLNIDSLCRQYDSRDCADVCACENRTHVLQHIYEDGIFVETIVHKVGE